MSRFVIIYFFLVTLPIAWGQADSSLNPLGKEAVENCMFKLRAAKTDEDKKEANELLVAAVENMLNDPKSFVFPFAVKTLGVVDSPDKSIRLFTWNVEWEDFTQHYECFIMRFDDRRKEWLTHRLVDESAFKEERPTEILSENEWYGALYYQIVPFEKGNRDLYLVMGFDGFTAMSNRKILDVLYFSGKQVKLGASVFREGKEIYKRRFYEYAENAVMSMRYEPERNRVIMDHLSPESPNLKGFYAYYVPDMSYDAFVYDKGKWELKEDVIAINHKSPEKIELYVVGKDGQPVKKKYKNRWEDPSDSQSPASTNVHVAEQPEGTETENKSTKKQRSNRKSKKSKKAERKGKSNIYPTQKK